MTQLNSKSLISELVASEKGECGEQNYRNHTAELLANFESMTS